MSIKELHLILFIFFLSATASGGGGNVYEVPGDGATDAALESLYFNGKVYLFAKGIDDRIYVNIMDGAYSWSGWNEVPGEGTTDTALAAEWIYDPVISDFRLYLFAKGGEDNRIYYNTKEYSSEHWGIWQEVDGEGTTDAALEAEQYGDELYLFSKGIEDKQIFINKLNLRTKEWSGWDVVPGLITDAALSAETHMDKSGIHLYLFAAGIDKFVYVNVLDHKDWSGWANLGGTTNMPIEACSSHETLWLYFVGANDHNIYMTTGAGSSGIWANAPMFVSVGSNVVPFGTDASITVVQDGNMNLCHFLKGTDNRIYYRIFYDNGTGGFRDIDE